MGSTVRTPGLLSWSPAGRALTFVLAATSIWCLLAEFYGLCSMRTFTLFVSIPATVALAGISAFDLLRGDGRLWRGVAIGAVAGLVAAGAYDVFRLPFVYAAEWGLEGIVPRLPLFKVFPRFGAMILGEPVEQASYSAAAVAIGWAYHFSNGLTFGVMYAAALGDVSRRSWFWGVVMAVAIEIWMLLSPYPRFFGIAVGAVFVGVTLTAHVVFGVALGLFAKRLSDRWAVPQAA